MPTPRRPATQPLSVVPSRWPGRASTTTFAHGSAAAMSNRSEYGATIKATGCRANLSSWLLQRQCKLRGPAASARVREHRKGASNRVGALGHGTSLWRMVHLNANWDHRIGISDFRTNQRPISAFSVQEKVEATDAFSRIACILTIAMSGANRWKLTEKPLRRATIAADAGSMAPRSGERHDRWCQFAFSLTNRAHV